MQVRNTSTPVYSVRVHYIRQKLTTDPQIKVAHTELVSEWQLVRSPLRTFFAELTGVSLRADALSVVAGAVVAAVRHLALIMSNEHNYISGMFYVLLLQSYKNRTVYSDVKY
jgi:hypothetical protein